MSATALNEKKLVVSEQCYEWVINNSDIKKRHNVIESPIFRAKTPDGKQLEWALRFYPRGHATGRFNCASVQLVSLNSCSVWVRFRLSITQNLKLVHEYDSGFRPHVFPHPGWERGERFVRKFLIMDEMTGLLKDNNLSIFCYLDNPMCEANSVQRRLERDTSSNNQCTSEPDDILIKLMSDIEFGDVVIEANGKIFRGHRVLLSSHSKLFAEIIRKTQQEGEELVSIDDIDDQVFMEILRFVYFNKIHEIEKHAKDLFAAARRYSMEALRKMCVIMVSKSVTPENAVQYLELADHFELEDLRKQIVEFVASNLTAITRTSSFKTMKEMKRGLLFELIQTMATKLKPV